MIAKSNKNFNRIKLFSTLLITSALGLELTNLYAERVHHVSIQGLDVIFALERFALVAHSIEGIIAAVYAPSRTYSPLKYGIYTFFVGTVGLIELFRQQKS